MHSSMLVTVRPEECRIRTAFCLPYPIPFTLTVTVVKPSVRACNAAQQKMSMDTKKHQPPWCFGVQLGMVPPEITRLCCFYRDLASLESSRCCCRLRCSSQSTGRFHRAWQGNMATGSDGWQGLTLLLLLTLLSCCLVSELDMEQCTYVSACSLARLLTGCD